MFSSKQRNTLAIASAFATVFAAGIAQAAPHPAGGRVFSSDKAGLERPAQVHYKSGRVDPGTTGGIYRHDGRKVESGRQG